MAPGEDNHNMMIIADNSLSDIAEFSDDDDDMPLGLNNSMCINPPHNLYLPISATVCVS